MRLGDADAEANADVTFSRGWVGLAVGLGESLIGPTESRREMAYFVTLVLREEEVR